MMINLKGLVSDAGAVKVAVVMVLVATAVKWLPALVMQKLFAMTGRERRMMFGLSNAHAAAALAVVLVGHNIGLFNTAIFNGTVVMILFSCIISSVVTERVARRFATEEALQLQHTASARAEQEQIMIPVANPATLEELIQLALVIRDTRRKTPLIALSVIDDSSPGDYESKMQQGRHNLEKAARIAAAADAPMSLLSRYDTNIASGIMHAATEYGATDIVIGLHQTTRVVDSIFGNLTDHLLKGTHREVMIARFMMPVNTLRRIIVAAPPKAEIEPGFAKWVGQFCRMSATLGCKLRFVATEQTLACITALVQHAHSTTLAEFRLIGEWGDLRTLDSEINFDHLLVLICARRGSISHESSLDRLPSQLYRTFPDNSLLVVYPDQFGDPQDTVTFADPLGRNEPQQYDRVGQWFSRWFRRRG
jgi:nucleotide-binding universal stress UspA family protein